MSMAYQGLHFYSVRNTLVINTIPIANVNILHAYKSFETEHYSNQTVPVAPTLPLPQKTNQAQVLNDNTDLYVAQSFSTYDFNKYNNNEKEPAMFNIVDTFMYTAFILSLVAILFVILTI